MLLATRPGEIVTREEIQKALWGDDTFVDFEHGINFSIKQIREALGDSAEKPRYVETVPRVGYRFIAGAESEVEPANFASGHLLFGRNGIVYAVGIDLEKLELRGTSVPVLEGVAMWSSPGDVQSASGVVYYDISRDGALVFSPREARLPQRTLVFVDREGRRQSVSHSKQAYTVPHFSPDGRRIAVTVEMDVGSRGAFLLDVATDAWTRIGSDGDLSAAAWLPDGKRLLLNGSWPRHTGLLLAHVDASEPPQEVHLGEAATLAVAPDGGGILFAKQDEPAQWDIWRLMLRGRLDTEPWLATTSRENSPSFSPDGRWVAYRSDESGRTEIYARPYAGQAGRHQVSTRGGVSPRWSPDGKEIFFSSLVARNGNQGSLWSVAVRTSPRFAADPPRKLFDLSDEILTGRDFYDVSPDGQRFVMVQRDPSELRPLDVVIAPGWIAEMKARLAAAK